MSSNLGDRVVLRSTSACSMWSPPANKVPTTVSALAPPLAAPGRFPRIDTLVDQLGDPQLLRQQRRSDQPGVGAISPALGTRLSSSNVTDTRARLCDAFT
ncbi:MAG: hypothetical protein M3N52_02235 [Actinomycetota bacterium]|nr:hypothetical protein [Actinomycetota bacterium]